MTRSRRHKNLKDLVAHHLSPLHLFSPAIKVAMKTQFPPIKKTIFMMISAYDRLYRALIL